MVTGKRNITADLLKGVAVILMIQVHILELFSLNDVLTSNIGSVLLFLGGPPAAPVFMIIMGYFIAKVNPELKSSLKRGIKIILIGLLLNTGLNLHLFIKIYQEEIIADPLPYLFGVDILFLAGLSIIVIGIVNEFFRNKLTPLIILIIVLSIPEIFSSQWENFDFPYLTAYLYSDAWWSYFPVIPWISYPITGYLFYLIWPDIKKHIRHEVSFLFIFLVSLIILISTLQYGIRTASKLEVYYHHDILYFLFIINFMISWTLLFRFIANKYGNKITQFVRWVGINVTTFYIIQWLIIGNIATKIYKTQTGLQSFGWFIIVLMLTSVFTLLWNKIITSRKLK